MDVFSDALRSLRLRDFKPGLSERRAPWGTHYPARFWDVVFYAVRGEPCWITLDSPDRSFRMAENSICILPHGDAHALRDSTETTPLPVRRVRPEGYHGMMQYGARQGKPTLVLMGGFKLEYSGRNPLWDSLPALIHLKPAEAPAWLDTLFTWFRQEMTDGDPGYASVCSRIGELLIIQSIRMYVSQLTEDTPDFLGALKDPYVLKALNLMHAQSSRNWTLQSLAREVGISRSTLAARFSARFGEGPLHYLTNLRINRAAVQLIETENKISAIIENVGYQSEPSFNAAFKKSHGVPPGTFRRIHREAASQPPGQSVSG